MSISRRKFMKSSAAAAAALALWWNADSVLEAAERQSETFDPETPQWTFAASEIAAAATHAKRTTPIVEMKIDSALGAQCYKIEHAQTNHLIVTGGDANGAMYGGLDVAEAIRLGTLAEVKSDLHTPYIAQRGIKFNIPLDVRTPSYSDGGDSAQHNIPEMWSMEFWHEFLDEMARDRYNVLTLWNLHPFPSLVKVPEYPDVVLADVQRTTIKRVDVIGGEGRDMVTPGMLESVETLKKISIDQKIAFWRAVMQYAYDRGIGIYWFTWNIFVWGTDGKYGINTEQDNPTTIDYFRKSVRETLLTYPLLLGFGITAGENMQSLTGEFTNEKWLWKTYGEGIADVKKLQPERSIRLIHRFHYTNVNDITDAWKNYPDTFDFSYKYSVAHMYSSPNPPFVKDTLAALSPTRRTWLTVRNDDLYSFRWGDPDYVRAYIHGMPKADQLAGFYMGPDGYTWGREFLSTEPETPRQLVIKKQNYSFMLWGRLSYDPALPNALFEKTLAVQFPEVSGSKLFAAYQAASQIIPQTTRFFWGGNGNDFEWFPEACIRKPGGSRGFYSVTAFMTGHTMPGSHILSIKEYTLSVSTNTAMTGITPLQVADHLTDHAETTLTLLGEMAEPKSKELRHTLSDLTTMAHLGYYYAEKIRGATDLALFEKTGKAESQVSAIRHLEAALEHWTTYAALYSQNYQPQMLTRIGYVDIPALTEFVRLDVEIARASPVPV